MVQPGCEDDATMEMPAIASAARAPLLNTDAKRVPELMVVHPPRNAGPVRRRRQWRWRIAGFVLVLWAAALAVCLYVLYIVQRLLHGAHVSLSSASIVINHSTVSVLDPHVQFHAPQPHLGMPWISFTATVHPFQALVLVDLDINDLRPTKNQILVGVMHIDKELHLESGRDVNMSVTGVFDMQAGAYLPQIVHRFVFLPHLRATLKASVGVSGTVWGWMPIYLPRVPVEHTMSIAAFNSFETEPPSLHAMNAGYGQPHSLSIGCSASVYNPSPITLIVNEPVEMRVSHRWNDADHVIGKLSHPGLTIVPGTNIRDGTLTIEKRKADSNTDAIADLITSYMGGIQNGVSSKGNKPLLVSVLDDGYDGANSNLLKKALKGLNASLMLHPAPSHFIRALTVDVTIRGSIVHWPPALYSSTVHLMMHNPLPATARLESVRLEVYDKNLSGPLLYHFHRDLDPSSYVVPQGQETLSSFGLYKSESAQPENMEHIKEFIQKSAEEKTTFGINAVMNLILEPAYKQQVNYKDNDVPGVVCYHAASPRKVCGATDSP